MSLNPTPGGFSLQFGASSSPKESVNELFLRTASNPAFPFLLMKLIKDESVDDVSIEIKVNKKIYEFLKAGTQSSDILFYLSTNGTIGQWGFDMTIAMKILSELEIFSKINDWTKAARNCLAKLIDNEKIETSFDNDNALKNSEELLNALEIFEQVQKTDLIFSAATEVLKEKVMDSATMIYRLAMAIYHSDRGADRSIIPAIDDPSSAYLKLIKSNVYNKWEAKFSEMMNLPLESKIKITKVIVAFTIASYVYHKIAKGGN